MIKWMQTANGQVFEPTASVEKMAEQLDLFTIAHALSNICRFGGHTKNFSSVARHSVLTFILADRRVPDWTGKPTAWHALMHDAAEAFIGDMIQPLKYSGSALGEGYLETEQRIMAAVEAMFDLDYSVPEIDRVVKFCDKLALVIEARAQMVPGARGWIAQAERDLLDSELWSYDSIDGLIETIHPYWACVGPSDPVKDRNAFVQASLLCGRG